MILNNTPTNKAVLSNVAQVNSFAIKATANSFQILSSGLYANKIKAIIRELSCNAYDSHVAANKADIPFDIHLPNKLDPNFSIRDYGVGLAHDEVINVYTTYFESTKTSSNEFVGALGLGSKSPFSYTDNFTVTTIKDGIKGIYSAFINDSGVPSIALMSQFNTDEPTGVEIKFPVSNTQDMIKFISEAVNVLVWFKIKPNVTGSSAYNGYHDQMKYWSDRPIELDIIPGIHIADKHQQFSNAVMGNIAYPIYVPNIEQNLGDLGQLLNHRLIINFDIGELDFQASREGLAYSPKTIEAIKSKLQDLKDKMYSLFVEKASKIDKNDWIFSRWIMQNSSDNFWKSSLIEYIKQNPSDLYYVSHTNFVYKTKKEFPITAEKLQEFNIKLTILKRVSKVGVKKIDCRQEIWDFIGNNCSFFLNDTNKGAIGRVTESIMSQSAWCYGYNFIIEKIDKTKDYQIDSFFDLIYNPPQNTHFKVSSLPKSSDTKTRNSDVRILRLIEDTTNRSYSIPFRELIWKEEDSLDNIDDSTKKFYYIPLTGYSPITTRIMSLDFKETIRRLKVLDANIMVFGVRKADIKQVLSMSNWINVEDYIYTLIQNNKSDLLRSSINKYHSNFKSYFEYFNNDVLLTMLSDDSPLKKILVKLKTKTKIICTYNNDFVYDLDPILNDFDAKFSAELTNYRSLLVEEIASVNKRYPLLSIVNDYRIAGSEQAIADYINLIDDKNQERKTLCTHI